MLVCKDFTKIDKSLTNLKRIQSCILARNKSLAVFLLSVCLALSLARPLSLSLCLYVGFSPPFACCIVYDTLLPYFSAVKDIFVALTRRRLFPPSFTEFSFRQHFPACYYCCLVVASVWVASVYTD